MPEFIGTQNSIDVQMRLRERQADIARTPALANGGRILHFVEPDQLGWDKVRALAEQDKLAGLAMVDREQMTALIHTHLGPEWKTPSWLAMVGSADQVLTTCASVSDAPPLPEGWEVRFHQCPSEDDISEVQALNAATSVSPYPAYYMRSEAAPMLTGCIHDEKGTLVATASVVQRNHPDSRLGGYTFAGMVSVLAAQRGRGLGKLMNAMTLTESHKCFGWRYANESVSPENQVSQAMIKACGLDYSAGLWSFAAINSDETFTR